MLSLTTLRIGSVPRVARTGRARREDTLAIDELYDEMEPMTEPYDWDEAARQNPGEPA